MKLLPLLYAAFLSMPSYGLYACNDSLCLSDTSQQPPCSAGKFNAPASRFILPAALIAGGALSQVSPVFKRFDRYVNRTAPHGNIKIDDYLQYAPAGAVYGLDLLAGIKAKHSLGDRTFVMVSSHVWMALSIHAVKWATRVERPDNSTRNSFPSGHTATAFTGAHILFKEYRESSPLIHIAGYATATVTGLLRIVNERHWLSDVVAGAGVGILSVEAGYLLLPVFRRMMGLQGDAALVPFAGKEMYGLAFSCRF